MPIKGSKKQFCKNGHDTFVVGRELGGQCSACRKTYIVKYIEDNKEHILLSSQEYYEDHKEDVLQRQKIHHEVNKEKINRRHRKHYKENKEYVNLKQKEYYESHKEEVIQRTTQYTKEHPEIRKAIKIKSQTERNLRVPLWTDCEEILEVYKNCPKNKTVDHIIPLKGKKVSGLHVSWNLQYLPLIDNIKKGNKADVFEISEWYGKLLEEIGLK